MKIIILFLIIIISLPCVGGERTRLVFSPHWLPQAQFAGFYVAQDQGFYEQEGLDVEIIHPKSMDSPINFLLEGRADIISLFLITALNERLNGLNIVNIAQLSQNSAILFVTKKTKGIETISDLDGKKIGIWMSGFDEVPKALIKDYNLEVKWIPVLSTVNLFLVDGIDIMTVMWYNEYNQVYLSGVDREELNTFFMSDYGYNIPEDGLYTLSKTAENRQRDLKSFVKATMKGWEYASQNREYTVELVVGLMREAHIPSNRAHQKWMLDRVLELQDVKDKNIQTSLLYPNDFNRAYEILKQLNEVSHHLKFEEFFQPALILKP